MRPISPPLARRGNVTIFDSMRPLYSLFCMGLPRFRLLSRATSLLVSVAVFTCALSLLCPATQTMRHQGSQMRPSQALAWRTRDPPRKRPAPDATTCFLNLHLGPAYPLYANNKDTIINQKNAPPLSAPDKILYAVHEQTRWAILMPWLISAGIWPRRQHRPEDWHRPRGLRRSSRPDHDPPSNRPLFRRWALYGALPSGPPLLPHRPGTLVHRGLLAVKQTYVRMNDEGQQRPSYSGLLGHATGSFLAMTYYPQQSATAAIAARGFGTAVAGDMGSKLLIEFGPDVLRLALRRKP